MRATAHCVGPCVYVYGPVRFLGTNNVQVGGSEKLYDNVLFETEDAGEIRIADDFRSNRGTVIRAHTSITMGNGCLVGEYVSIRDNHHGYEDGTRRIGAQGFGATPITIGDDVWIGRRAVALQGVTIGRGAVIAADGVVNKDVPAMGIWAVVPAQFFSRCQGGAAP